jgi:hypothetical protein
MPETATTATPAAGHCVTVAGWVAWLKPSTCGWTIDLLRPTPTGSRLVLTRDRFDRVAAFAAITHAASECLLDRFDRSRALNAIRELRRAVDAAGKEGV